MLMLWANGAFAQDDGLRCEVIKDPHAESHVLHSVFNRVASYRVDQTAAAKALAELNRYVDARTERGESSTLCLGLLVDALEAAAHAGWRVDTTAQLLIAFQGRVDANRGGDSARLRNVPNGRVKDTA